MITLTLRRETILQIALMIPNAKLLRNDAVIAAVEYMNAATASGAFETEPLPELGAQAN